MKLGKVVGICLLISILLISFISCSLAIEPREQAEAEVVKSPSTPQNVKVAVAARQQGADEVTLSVSWDSVDSATGYIVYYQTDEEVFTGERSTIPSVLPQTTFTVRADEIYLIRVASMVSSGRNSLSAESEPVFISTINNIDDVSTVLSGNRLRIIIRYPSVVYDGRMLADPKFHVTLTNVETEERKSFFLSTPSYDFPGELAPSSSYTLTVRMGFDDDGNKEISDREMIAEWTSPEPFTTDADAYPDALESVNAQMSGKDGILVSFTAPPVKHGLDESVQRRFSIVRTQDGSEEGVEVHSRELLMEFDGDDFHLVDRGSEEHPLLANVSYTYSVVSYYYFSDSNAYNAQDEDEAAQSNPAHIFSVPVNVQASIQADEEVENSFTETVTFDFPFGIEEVDEVVLERRETTVASDDPEWVDVEDSTFSTSEADKSKVTVTSTLTTGTSGNHDYSYRVKVIRGEIESEYGLSENVVSTNPSANVIADFVASENLAGHVELSWTLVNAESVSIRLYRSESSDYSGSTLIPDSGFENNSYDDTDVEDGRTYYYALAARQGDSTQYRYLSAKSMDAVSGISATKGEYSDRIIVTWTGVEGASTADLYKVYFRLRGDEQFTEAGAEDGGPIFYDSATGLYSYSFTRDAGTSSAGRTYQFVVRPVDGDGHVSGRDPLPENIAEGNMLGPATIVVNVSKGEYGDSILVKWNAVPGASQYVIRVYSSPDASQPPIAEKRVVASADMSYAFSAEDVSAIGGYALSQSYWFSIFPQFNSEVSDSGTDLVEGYWVKPPMDIVASKAESSEATYLRWSPVEEASRYYVYRREKGSLDEWTLVANVLGSSPECTIYDIDSGNRAKNPVWEYTASTVIAGVEGPLQNWFEDTDTSDGYPDNVGFPLYHPENIRISELERNGGTPDADYLLKITFQLNPYATGYVLSPSVGADVVSIDMEDEDISDSVIEDSVVSDGDMYVVDNELTVVMRRPVIRSSVHYSISFSSVNEKISHPTDRQSYEYGMSLTPSKLRLSEVVNLANSALGDAISRADEYFENDWWANEEWTDNDYYYGPESNRQIHAHRKDGGLNYDSGESYIDINAYQVDRVQVSGHLGFGLDTGKWYEGEAGYLGPDYLNSVTSTGAVTVILPPGHGHASISYDGVNASSGSYTVSVTYDDGSSVSGTVNASDVQVSPI